MSISSRRDNAFQHVTGIPRACAPLLSRHVHRSVGGACARARSRRPSRRRSWSFSSGAFLYRASIWASTPRSGSRRSLRSAAFSSSLRRFLAAEKVRTRKASPVWASPARLPVNQGTLRRHPSELAYDVAVHSRRIAPGIYDDTANSMESGGFLSVCVAHCCSSSPQNARGTSWAFVLYRGAFPRRARSFSGIINRLYFWHLRKTNDTYDLAA